MILKFLKISTHVLSDIVVVTILKTIWQFFQWQTRARHLVPNKNEDKKERQENAIETNSVT